MTRQDAMPEPSPGGTLLISDHAYAVLRRDILLGVFRPGAALRIADLRARYDIGSSPLREALFRLASDRLVRQETNRGFRVPPLDRGDWADIVAMRRRLEPGAAEAAVRAGDEAWEEALLVAHRRLKRLGPVGTLVAPLAESGRQAQWEECHRHFHRTLIAACGSGWTIRFCDLLCDQFDLYRRFAPPRGAVQERLAAQHDDILAAALDRDGPACRTLLDEHVALTGEAVAEGLTRLL